MNAKPAEVVATAPTLGAGLAAVSRCFGALQEQTAVTLDRRDGDAALSYQVRDGRIVHRRQDAELSLGALIALLRAAKPWLFTRSTSSHAAPPSSVPPAPRRVTEMTEHEWRQARADLLRQR